jgi:predicted DNA-binding transcriptional regulator AlpA
MESNMPPRAVNKTHRPAALPEGDVGFLRLPAVLTLFPIGESSWWRGVAEGRYPKPVKLSTRVSAWRVSDIRRLLDAYANDEAAR